MNVFITRLRQIHLSFGSPLIELIDVTNDCMADRAEATYDTRPEHRVAAFAPFRLSYQPERRPDFTTWVAAPSLYGQERAILPRHSVCGERESDLITIPSQGIIHRQVKPAVRTSAHYRVLRSKTKPSTTVATRRKVGSRRPPSTPWCHRVSFWYDQTGAVTLGPWEIVPESCPRSVAKLPGRKRMTRVHSDVEDSFPACRQRSAVYP